MTSHVSLPNELVEGTEREQEVEVPLLYAMAFSGDQGPPSKFQLPPLPQQYLTQTTGPTNTVLDVEQIAKFVKAVPFPPVDLQTRFEAEVPLYVNPKQYKRIEKRRQVKARRIIDAKVSINYM